MKHFCLLQSYVFRPQNTKKMSSQKVHIFLKSQKKVHKKFTRYL